MAKKEEQTLTARYVKDEFDTAIGDFWDEDHMYALVERLRVEFPTWRNTLDLIESWAGIASNENVESGKNGPTGLSDDLHTKVMHAIDRMFQSPHRRRMMPTKQKTKDTGKFNANQRTAEIMGALRVLIRQAASVGCEKADLMRHVSIEWDDMEDDLDV